MEKIYMEDSSSQSRSSKQSRRELGLSVVLSFVVAFFAIFSLIACGISQVSYAAPQTNPPTGDFIFYEGNRIKADDSENSEDFLNVPMYFSDAGLTQPIFCIEHHNEKIDSGATTYSKGTKISDNGLVYILEHSYVNGRNIVYNSANNLSTTDADLEKYVETWATQAAIWYYLYLNDSTATNSTSLNYMSQTQVNAVLHANEIVRPDNNQKVTIANLGTIVSGFVNDVIANHTAAQEYSFTLSKEAQEVDDDGHAKYTLTEDGQYYQSKAFTVSSTDNPLSYTVTLSGDINDAFVVDADGNTLENGLLTGNQFFVRIPKASVSESETKHVNVKVTAQFNLYAGYYYSGSQTNSTTVLAAEHQKVVSLVNEKVTRDRTESLEIIGSPDTSMTTAQTIYFIGLVVLLCGIGIVYANAKPAQSKQ